MAIGIPQQGTILARRRRGGGVKGRGRTGGKGEPRKRSDAERQRANAATAEYRARLDRGEAIAPTPYNAAMVGLLIDLGWLALNVSENRHEIGLALYRMVNLTAKQHERGL